MRKHLTEQQRQHRAVLEQAVEAATERRAANAVEAERRVNAWRAARAARAKGRP